ncbi:uncharacterized protein LOC127709963 [Mytilus californianus]|uniref:uncharacterized protein LOC127709963 n=1 Tax=Mytilus californianus TaxID=6549 RepID=UPI002245220E|nr:uncharacterized protein LOC127709963 [Mytilus californianus]
MKVSTLYRIIQLGSGQFLRCPRKLSQFPFILNKRFYNVVSTQQNPDSKDYVVDLRSDTVTKPSTGMRKAMAEAEVGDDVYGEDGTINELQRRMADMFGKEKALFVPTGTMGNLLSMCVHCPSRGEEAILGSRSHIFVHEQGGIAHIAGVLASLIENKPDGTFDIEIMKQRIRQIDDPHFPFTRVICLENTHNFCGGKVVPLSFMEEVYNIAKSANVNVHLDGARVLNAATALNVPVKDILKYTDTVNMCFSKGLSAPVGSVIAGSEEFVDKARRLRKAFGGGIRQGGVLAAAAMYALDNVLPRLHLDHENTKLLSQGIMESHNDLVNIDLSGVHTNIVFITMLKDNIPSQILHDRLLQVTEEEKRELGDVVIVKTVVYSDKLLRFVLHNDVSSDDVELAKKKFQFILHEIAEKMKLS